MRALAWIAPLLLATGCAEAPPPGAVPPISYGARHAIPWQQFCEQALSVPQASALAAARGADGWELVAMYNGVLCYKRPAPLPVAPGAAGNDPSGPAGTIPVITPSTKGPRIRVIPDPGF
jgi:hypothetical protein